LVLDKASDLGFLRRIPPLTDLSLEGLEGVTDFSALSGYQGLESLTLTRGHHLSELSALPDLSELRLFSIHDSPLDCGLAELIAALRKVQFLYLDFCDWVSDLSALPSSPLLSDLRLWGCKAVSDINPLANCTGLRHLDLDGTGVSDISPLSNLTSLRTLWLKDCEDVSDLTPLQGLHGLRTLYIQGIAPETDLAPLLSISSLTIHVYSGQNVRGGKVFGRRLQRDPSPEFL
jgi:internalin A